jgi:hypothetical protein
MAVPSGRSSVEIVGSNPTGGIDICFKCCVLSRRGVCFGLITRPEESYRVWYVVVCDLENSMNEGGPWPIGGRSCRTKTNKTLTLV